MDKNILHIISLFLIITISFSPQTYATEVEGFNDLTIHVRYDSKPLPAEVEIIGSTFSAWAKGPDALFHGVIDGEYIVRIFWLDSLVAEEKLSVSKMNREFTVTAEVMDLTIRLTDLEGRPLSGAVIFYKSSSGFYGSLKEYEYGVYRSEFPLPYNDVYIFEISWKSPIYNKIASVTFESRIIDLSRLESIKLPVGDVVVALYDVNNKPVSGAKIELEGVVQETNIDGITVFKSLPLESSNGNPITYVIQVLVNQGLGEEWIKRARYRVSKESRVINITAYTLVDIVVKVIDGEGKPVKDARVVVKRGGIHQVSESNTDENGVAVFRQIIAADYVIEATYLGVVENLWVFYTDIVGRKMKENTFTIIISKPTILSVINLPAIIGLPLLILVVFGLWRWMRLRKRGNAPVYAA